MPIEVKELLIRTTVDEAERADSIEPTVGLTMNYAKIRPDTIEFGDLTDDEPDDTDPVPIEDFSLNFEEIKYTPPPEDVAASDAEAAAIDPYKTFKFQIEFEG